MRYPRQESHNHAQRHSVGQKDSWRACLISFLLFLHLLFHQDIQIFITNAADIIRTYNSYGMIFMWEQKSWEIYHVTLDFHSFYPVFWVHEDFSFKMISFSRNCFFFSSVKDKKIGFNSSAVFSVKQIGQEDNAVLHIIMNSQGKFVIVCAAVLYFNVFLSWLSFPS